MQPLPIMSSYTALRSLATRDYQLWTHRSPLMARSPRGRKKKTWARCESVRDVVRERERERERPFPQLWESKTVGVSLFVSATTFFPRGHTHTHTHTHTLLTQQKDDSEVSNWVHSLVWPCVPVFWPLTEHASLVQCWHAEVCRSSASALRGPRSQRCVHRSPSSLRSLRPCMLWEWHYPNSVIIKKTSKEHSSAWLASTMRERDKYLLSSTATATHSLCSSSLNAPPPQ